nr:MAG TPA: hypothetical protein [Caudoviricetes sp.]
MEYISAEEFLKQSDKVQREFKEYFDGESMLFWNNECLVYWGFEDILINTPAITEGPLRKFIEDKTKYKIDINYYEINGYDLALTEGKTNYFNYLDLGHDLLQAYWKVACEIASSEVNKHE